MAAGRDCRSRAAWWVPVVSGAVRFAADGLRGSGGDSGRTTWPFFAFRHERDGRPAADRSEVTQGLSGDGLALRFPCSTSVVAFGVESGDHPQAPGTALGARIAVKDGAVLVRLSLAAVPGSAASRSARMRSMQDAHEALRAHGAGSGR